MQVPINKSAKFSTNLVATLKATHIFHTGCQALILKCFRALLLSLAFDQQFRLRNFDQAEYCSSQQDSRETCLI